MPQDYIVLFPFAEYFWHYAAFIGFVLVMLALDLGVFHRHAHVVKFREAVGWSIFWVSLALVFCFVLYHYSAWKFGNDPALLAATGKTAPALAWQVGLEFLTGFVVEKALAVDNIFVFVVVFRYFGIPAIYQHKVLFWGVLGALFFRAVFIALGAVLMKYEAVVIIFGLFLIFTGARMAFAGDEPVDPGHNRVIGWLRRVLRVVPDMKDGKFFSKIDGRWHATPLLVALLFLEFSDIIFAVDSVPAIFALTKEPFLVFTSNIFAILGLRSLYFLLAGMVDKFVYLKYGLAAVLVFVGLKMVWLNHLFGGKFPISVSLGIILFCIVASVVASLVWPPAHSRSGANPPSE
jgi:tellurite resistance protein TerC